MGNWCWHSGSWSQWNCISIALMCLEVFLSIHYCIHHGIVSLCWRRCLNVSHFVKNYVYAHGLSGHYVQGCTWGFGSVGGWHDMFDNVGDVENVAVIRWYISIVGEENTQRLENKLWVCWGNCHCYAPISSCCWYWKSELLLLERQHNQGIGVFIVCLWSRLLIGTLYHWWGRGEWCWWHDWGREICRTLFVQTFCLQHWGVVMLIVVLNIILDIAMHYEVYLTLFIVPI